MKLAIVGSRTFNDYNLLKQKILENYDINDIELIVSGGAVGADKLSEIFSKEYNIKMLIFYPDWGRFGKVAGFKRNIDIIKNSDEVIAFTNGSKGTAHSIDLARKSNKRVTVVNF